MVLLHSHTTHAHSHVADRIGGFYWLLCGLEHILLCSWMVLLLLYQMTRRIINQWNNWIIITIICEPPWTVCDEAEPCNFLLFEVTICHDPVYHAHTSCHLMTPGYCLTSVRQSAAPQQHWRPLWLLIRYWYSPHHHHGPVTGTWQTRFLFLCV